MDINLEKISHGYLIYGDKKEGERKALKLAGKILKTAEEKLLINPDFLKTDYDSFGVGESRSLKERASTKSVTGENKVFILSANVFTREAQNALLKLFEDPPKGVHFFIITPNQKNILPTLLSRLVAINAGREEIAEKTLELAKEFFSDNPIKKLNITKKIVEKKDKNLAIEFLNALELTLKEDDVQHLVLHKKCIEEIQKARKFLNIKGSSTKLILEHLALSI